MLHVQIEQVLVLLLRPVLVTWLDEVLISSHALLGEPFRQTLCRHVPMLRAMFLYMFLQEFVLFRRPHESIRVILSHLLGQLEVPSMAFDLWLAHHLCDRPKRTSAFYAHQVQKLRVFFPVEIC